MATSGSRASVPRLISGIALQMGSTHEADLWTATLRAPYQYRVKP